MLFQLYNIYPRFLVHKILGTTKASNVHRPTDTTLPEVSIAYLIQFLTLADQ